MVSCLEANRMKDSVQTGETSMERKQMEEQMQKISDRLMEKMIEEHREWLEERFG